MYLWARKTPLSFQINHYSIQFSFNGIILTKHTMCTICAISYKLIKVQQFTVHCLKHALSVQLHCKRSDTFNTDS